MSLDPVIAHLLCVALVLLDQLARALRLRLLTGAIGHPVALRDAVATNAIGDAACAVTPMRIGGEPARLAALLRAGVPATASFIAIGFEVVTMWPVILMTALVLAVAFAPGWIDHAAPQLLAGLARTWEWVLMLAAITAAIWIVVRRRVNVTPRLTRRPWKRSLVYRRRMSKPALLTSAALGFVNLATRTAILPVLMATLPDPPAPGTALLGSFALLYSQLVLPTPAGAGVVDLGLLAGAAGGVGEGGVGLLVWWRFYTTVLGVIAGAGFALHDFGWQAVRRKWWRTPR